MNSNIEILADHQVGTWWTIGDRVSNRLETVVQSCQGRRRDTMYGLAQAVVRSLILFVHQ